MGIEEAIFRCGVSAYGIRLSTFGQTWKSESQESWSQGPFDPRRSTPRLVRRAKSLFRACGVGMTPGVTGHNYSALPSSSHHCFT